jgi:hypothetical protein
MADWGKLISKSELFTRVNEICKTKNSLRYYKLSLKAKRKIIVDVDKKIV